MSNGISTALDSIAKQLVENTNITGQILKEENLRLITKQNDIANARFGQRRIVDLNRSQMKRTAAYTKVGVLTVVSLGVIFILKMFGNFIPIPEAIVGIIYVLLISLCVLYGLYVYSDVNGRESTNFDRYVIPSPVVTVSEAEKAKLQTNAVATGNLIAANAGNQLCSGQACCDLYSAYSSSTNKCNACALNGTVSGSGYYDNTANACATCTSGQTWKLKTNSTTEYECHA